MKETIVINISLTALIWLWLSLKLITAIVLQRYYAIYMFNISETSLEHSPTVLKFVRHFVRNFLVYPEFWLLWVIVWLILAILTWTWSPRSLLPQTYLKYLEYKDGL
jgi:hypothetical protein